MHLIIPYAASHSFNGPEALSSLKLPHLQALLTRMPRHQMLTDPADTPLDMPHERLLAELLGWGLMGQPRPWAAWQTASPNAADPLAAPAPDTPALPQAWITPCHWQIGMDQVLMANPASLALSDTESRQLLQAMQPFFEEDGLQLRWHSALLWHAQGRLLADVSTASMDRVIGQNIQDWLPQGPAARSLQRLQSEMQMLIYNHPVNDAREARRQAPVNAFWLHGAGALPAKPHSAASATVDIVLDDTLRDSALHGDLTAWQAAWQTLDATALRELLHHVQRTGQGQLSVCSEQAAHTYQAARVTWRLRLSQLFQPPTPAKALQALISP